jgi:puromycin-sensitive aminopeptidase
MIEGYLGEDRFREGIRLYMRRHREGNATADDLWGALAEASGEPIVELANGWIREVGYPVVSAALAGGGAAGADGAVRLALRQRRFFADPDSREDGPAKQWLIPAVLRFRDDEGVKEQRVLLRDREKEVALAARGSVSWCVVNAGAAGFYRCQYDAGLLARLRSAAGELAPAERMALVSDQWALVRAGAAPVADFLDLVAGLAAERDHFVLEEVVTRLSVIEHRHVTDADRPHLQEIVGELFAAPAKELGWGGAPAGSEDDDTRLRRAAVLRAAVGLARVRPLVAEAEQRFATQVAPPAASGGTGGGGSPSSPLDPNLLEVVVAVAARTADQPRFEEIGRRAATEVDPASKRRFLHALARVETPELVDRAIDLALSERVPMQDFTSYLSVLLGNRATREGAWRLIRTRWPEVRAKADSPMLLRRLVEALGNLPERRHLEEVEQLLAKHPMEAARQATAQTLERMRTDVALRERLLPEVGAWLRRRLSA